MKKLLFTQRRLVHHHSMVKVVGVVLLCAFIFSSLFSEAQNPLVKMWDKRFGSTWQDWLTCFHQTKDGGFILGGYTYSTIGGDKTENSLAGWDYWIVKTDSLGNKQWDKNLGGMNNDWLNAIQQTLDGGYILGGYSKSRIGGDKTEDNRDTTQSTEDYWIIKTDSLGNKQWDKDFGGTDADFLNSIKQTNDRGYILGGYSYSSVGGDKTQDTVGVDDYWIIKIDSLGIKQWDKNFGGTDADELFSIQQTKDSGYILGGYSFSNAGGDKSQNTFGVSDYWIIKTDSIGNKQWDQDFGGTNYEHLYAMQQTTDGGFILGGTSGSVTDGNKTTALCWQYYHDFWIIKTDSIGNKQWEQDIGGPSNEYELRSVTQTSDMGYLISGFSFSGIGCEKTESNLGQGQTWVVKTDSLGNTVWDKTLHTNTPSIFPFDELGLAVQTSDGCYAFANYTHAGIGGDKTQPNWDTSSVNPSADYWIVKFCDSTLTTNIANTDRDSYREENDQLLLSPNPCEGRLAITSLQKAITKIELYNTLGEKVLTAAVNREPFTVNCEPLPSGIYILKAFAGENVLFGKVVKE